MWKKYFKVIKIVPGRVIIPGHGTVDFSREDLPLELIKELYENDFPYLEITDQGKEIVYNIKPPAPQPEKELPRVVTAPGEIPLKEKPGYGISQEESKTSGENPSPAKRKKRKSKKIPDNKK
jgi:hypothetical protein